MSMSYTARDVERLVNAADAVLDSDGGVRAMAELAEALHSIDGARDYREQNPIAPPDVAGREDQR